MTMSFDNALVRIAARAGDHDRSGTWPADDLADLAAAGATRWEIPGEYGGDPLSPLDLHLRYERVATASVAAALILTQRDAGRRAGRRGRRCRRTRAAAPAVRREPSMDDRRHRTADHESPGRLAGRAGRAGRRRLPARRRHPVVDRGRPVRRDRRRGDAAGPEADSGPAAGGPPRRPGGRADADGRLDADDDRGGPPRRRADRRPTGAAAAVRQPPWPAGGRG